MPRRGTEIVWCWAGLATIVLLGLALSEARDLFSATERVVGVNAGRWIGLADFGIDDVEWSFQITPLAAWWGIAAAGVVILAGWSAHRAGIALPLGMLGGLLWLTTLGVLFAENLLLVFVLLSAQGMLGGVWLAGKREGPQSASDKRLFLAAMLIGDVIALWGVLLTGLAWGTFDLATLETENFIQESWRNRPALCGLAGTCVFLGVLGHALLFPFFGGTRIAAGNSGPVNALVFSGCVWPGLAWFLFRVQPILGCAPETVALVQGLSLLAAVIAAFVATAQTDSRRTVALLATSQIGLMLSVLAVPGTLPMTWLFVVIFLLMLSSAILFLSKTIHSSRWVLFLSWWMLAGGCLSPAFRMSEHAVRQFQHWPTAEVAAENENDVQAEQDSFRVQPLPAVTWTGAWCLWSFWASFAGWRAWKSRDGVTDHSPSFFLSVFMVLAYVFAAVYTSMLAFSDMHHGESFWHSLAATAASLAGGMMAAWVCRDPERTEANFQRLGVWADLARRELYLDEIASFLRDGPMRALLEVARFCEEILLPGAGRVAGPAVARRLVSAVDELRNETAAFYAVALSVTIATLLVTWLTLSI